MIKKKYAEQQDTLRTAEQLDTLRKKHAQDTLRKKHAAEQLDTSRKKHAAEQLDMARPRLGIGGAFSHALVWLLLPVLERAVSLAASATVEIVSKQSNCRRA